MFWLRRFRESERVADVEVDGSANAKAFPNVSGKLLG
jgi:hypothetical protein